MSDWDPKRYLKFEKERNQPAIDLVTRIQHSNPTNILDIGCGPGNSTGILFERWCNAKITGIDNSAAMLESAKKSNSAINWLQYDAGEDLSPLDKFDIIFSNAVFQWIPKNEILLPRLFDMLKEKGVLAAQVPYVKEMPIHKILIALAESSKWSKHFQALKTTYRLYSPEFYYEILCGLSTETYLWETRYFHIMNSPEDILEWYRSTGLRPYLDCFTEEEQRLEFEKEILAELKKYYPEYKNGKVLFPFHRIFFMAYK